MWYRSFAVAMRAAFAAFWIVASVYSLLAFIPFSYHQLIDARILGWQDDYVRLFPLLACAITLLLPTAFAPEIRSRRTRWWTVALLALALIGAAATLRWNFIAALELSTRSYVFSLLSLAPLVLIATIDFIAYRAELRMNGEENDSPLFQAAVGGALFMTLFYGWLSGAYSSARAFENAITLASHLFVFLLVFVVLATIRALARLTPRPTATELVLVGMLVAGVIGAAVYTIVFEPMSFREIEARIYAAALGLAISLTVAAAGLRNAVSQGRARRSGFALYVAAVPGSRAASPSARIVSFIALIVFALVASQATRLFDWDFMFQKLTAVLVAAYAFVVVHAIAVEWKRERQPLMFGAALAALALFVVFSPAGVVASQVREIESLRTSAASSNPSFRLLNSLLSAPPPKDRMKFYTFLQQSTNIGHDVKVPPVDIRLATERTPGERPHIFVFVIDSLRRDYISPYDHEVTFTPNIAALARDSIVFDKPFTPYGGTGLSQPALWTGSLMFHKQYVSPFDPMNSLQKLIDREQYQIFMMNDAILKQIVRIDDRITQLDTGGLSYDFCRTLADLETKIDRRDTSRPLFAYIQPQNLHIAAITREGGKTLDTADYGRFHPPYASRVKRLDRCLGSFLSHLRERGLYDSSIIVITSDHGDSLGEGGRWGHAYTIYPEVLRIPLLLKLPAAWRERFDVDRSQVVFLQDITPTLYYLLGYRGFVDDPLNGKPLLRRRDDAGPPVRPPRPHLVASSYGPIYGVLANDASSLYIADALNFAEHYFELDPRGVERKTPLPEGVREESEQWIEQMVAAINARHGFRPER